MANINDLRTGNTDNGITIDMTGGSSSIPTPNVKKPSLTINKATKPISTTNNASNNIKLNNNNIKQPALAIELGDDNNTTEEVKGKSVVSYDPNKSINAALKNKGKIDMNPRKRLAELEKDNNTTSAADTVRQTVNINELFPPQPDPNIHESIEKDILEGEGSIFDKFLKEKEAEASEWISKKEEEKELSEEISEDDEDLIDDDNKEEIETIEDDNHTDIGEVVYEELTDVESDNNMNEDLQIMEDEVIDVPEDVEEETTTEEELVEEDDNFDEEDAEVESIDTSELESNITTTTSVTIEEDKEEDDSTVTENVSIGGDTTQDTVSEEDTIEKLKRLASEKIKPVSEKLNIKSFTVVNKPVTDIKFLEKTQVKVAKWVLPSQESVVLMKQFIGLELDQLRDYSSETQSYTSMLSRFEMIYNHIMSEKPKTYKAWLKSTPYTDIDHYFFAIYIACYKGANYIPLDCSNDKCKEPFVSDSVDIMSMVKFTSDKYKKKFYDIYQNEEQLINPKGLYVSEIVPLTEQIAVSFKTPSIYDLLMLLPIDDKFKSKYKDIIDYIPFIDNMYIIDQASQSLIPIGYKEYPESEVKTTKSRIVKFHNVIKAIDPDAIGVIKAYRNSIATVQESWMTYVYPPCECPKCKTMTKEIPVTAEEAVFTRHQLGSFVTTTIN